MMIVLAVSVPIREGPTGAPKDQDDNYHPEPMVDMGPLSGL
jgi:hypothetical protein